MEDTQATRDKIALIPTPTGLALFNSENVGSTSRANIGRPGMEPFLPDEEAAFTPHGSQRSHDTAKAGNLSLDDEAPGTDGTLKKRVSFSQKRRATVSGPIHDIPLAAAASSWETEQVTSTMDDEEEQENHDARMYRKSESRTSSKSSRSVVTNIWQKMLGRSHIWDETSSSSSNDEGLNIAPIACMLSAFRGFYSTLKTAVTTPSILITCALVYAALLTCGILVVHGFNSTEESSRRKAAEVVAVQTDLFFTRVLERAFVPLFTMAQFVSELPEFHDMPFLVGDRCDPDEQDCSGSTAAPIMVGKKTHRDLTGIFPAGLKEKFDKIAMGIKANSGMGKALVNIQLAPKAVVSMLYPMVNCEDFDDGICLNNTGAWGHDLLNDPNRIGIARATVPANGVVTAGPLSLIQGTTDVVSDAFIARLPINMVGHSIVLDGAVYPCWGFAVILLNWAMLKEESDIYENFDHEGMQFKLTRTDVKINPDTGEETEIVKTIAESENSYLIANDNVTLDLATGDNNWVISVGYNKGFSPNYGAWGYPIVICSSFVFAIMVMLVLVSKKDYELILHKLMPKRAIAKLRKGETVVEEYNNVTIFFSDIVGYTRMASEMTPIEVMKMLNDLFMEFDKLAEKYSVFKVETIGDAYIAIGGAPTKCSGTEAAEKVALFALDVMKVVSEFETADGAKIFIRAGLASGPVVAGVVGFSLPKYTLFGDTVNFASRMESTSKQMRVQIAPITHRLLLDAPSYQFTSEERRDGGELGVEIKGKGRQFTYWLNSATERQLDSSDSNQNGSYGMISIPNSSLATQQISRVTDDSSRLLHDSSRLLP